MLEILKTCSKCGLILPESSEYFHKRKDGKNGLNAFCKQCSNKRQRDYSATKKGKEVRRKVDLKRRFGITPEDYDRMIDSQNNKCKICGIIPEINLSIDHNHDTGEIRGLLCVDCNLGIGNLKTIDNLKKAIRYLKDGKE